MLCNNTQKIQTDIRIQSIEIRMIFLNKSSDHLQLQIHFKNLYEVEKVEHK